MPFDPNDYETSFGKAVAPVYGMFSFFALIIWPIGFVMWFMLMLMTGQFKEKNRIQEEPAPKKNSTSVSDIPIKKWR